MMFGTANKKKGNCITEDLSSALALVREPLTQLCVQRCPAVMVLKLSHRLCMFYLLKVCFP